MIVTISADITASDDPTCSDEEKVALKAAEADVDAGLALIEAALEEFEDLVVGKISCLILSYLTRLSKVVEFYTK